jgi:hypothetical protein
MTGPAVSPFNIYLGERRRALAGAYRYALTPNCNPSMGPPPMTSQQLLKQLLHVPIVAAVAGDNPLIPTTAGQQLIYEMLIWNSSAANVNVTLYQGPSANGILLLPLPNVPPQTGITLGFNGSWEQPHFTIDIGQRFVMNLSTTGPVTGMIKYKINNGT